MADITMSLDDTLELDTIIKESTEAISSISVEKGGSHNINGIQTHTGIFDPVDPGDYILDINGQELTVKVKDPSNIPDTVIDFENGNISKFNGSTGSFSVESGGAYKGENYLQINGTSGQYIFSYPNDGLKYYPKRGDKFEVYYYGTGFNSGEPPFEEVPIFGVEDNSNYYSCFINGNSNDFQIRGGGSSDSVSVNYPNSTWLRIIIDFDSKNDGMITATLKDTSDESQIGQVSINDKSINGRGIGFEGDIWGSYNQDRRVDNWSMIK